MSRAPAAPPGPTNVVFISPRVATLAKRDHQHLTLDDLLLFVRVAQPGDSLIYFDGFLAESLGNQEIRRRALAVHALYCMGLVSLVQKKVRDRRYRYYMFRRWFDGDLDGTLDEVQRMVRNATTGGKRKKTG